MVRIGSLSIFPVADTSEVSACCGSCDGSAPQPIASAVASAAVTGRKLQGNGNLSMKSSFLERLNVVTRLVVHARWERIARSRRRSCESLQGTTWNSSERGHAPSALLLRASDPVVRCSPMIEGPERAPLESMLMTLMTDAASGLTRLLAAVGGGDAAAVDQLTPAVYEELRRLAKRHMAGQRRGHTLQTRDLIAEAYLKLVNVQETGWKDRIHFFAVASRAMRSVLVDYARRRGYAKRGGNPIRVSLSEAEQTSEQKSAEVIA